MSETQIENLSRDFLEHIRRLPGGANIDRCIQCGTCTASCPTSAAMNYSPRRTLAALRAQMLDRVVESNTPWLCTSCYSCTVRCPAKIPFTDVMYELKRLAVEHRLYPRRDRSSAMVRSFAEVVSTYGRSAEAMLVGRYYLRTNPLRIVEQAPLTLRLLARRRVRMLPDRIKGIDGLRRMLGAVQDKGAE